MRGGGVPGAGLRGEGGKQRSRMENAATASGRAGCRAPAASGWIDVTHLLCPGMVQWPGDPPFRSERFSDLERGDSWNVSALSFGSHTGTHVDPPLHVLRGAPGVDEMPLTAAIGRARVIQVRDPEAVKVEELRSYRIRRGERILFRTAKSGRRGGRRASAPEGIAISPAAAEYLAKRRVRTVGIDTLSVDAAGEGARAHRLLLGAGIWIIEGLDLSRVRPGDYDLICLPLRLARGDGAPVRALLRPLSFHARTKNGG